MTSDQFQTEDKFAVVPLIGLKQNDEASWLGALFSKLLIEHMAFAGLPVLDYETTAHQLTAAKLALPLTDDQLSSVRVRLKLRAIVQGRYVYDTESNMVGVQLHVHGPDISPVPLEASAPQIAFGQFMERIVLAILEQMDIVISEPLRHKIKQAPRPGKFEAIRQLAQAHSAWAKGQNELALASVTSALTIDPGYEDAATLEVAIARKAEDIDTTRNAFQRWSTIAEKNGRSEQAAERLMMLGHWLSERGEWTEARQSYENAARLFEAVSNMTGVARSRSNTANLDLQMGNIQSAIQAYRRSLRIFEVDPDMRRDAAVILLNLSQAHKILGQPEEALLAVQRAQTLSRQISDNVLQAHCLARRGALKHDLGEWGQAEADYRQAANLYDVLGNDVHRAIVRSHQGLLLKQQGNYTQAEELMVSALEEIDDSAPPHESAILRMNLAELYVAMGVYDRAWTYADQAHEMFKELKSSWTEQAEDMLQMIDRLHQTPMASSPPPPETRTPETRRPFAPLTPPADSDTLYNTPELYDNEDDNFNEDGSDGE